MEKKPIRYREDTRPGKERTVDETMASVKEDCSNILEQIRDSVDKHVYGGILGIDSSGRVPALVFTKTINLIYKSKKQEPIENRFIASSQQDMFKHNSMAREDNLRKFFQQEIYQKIKSRNEKVLIVDDFISSGNSLLIITKIMKEFGISYEIAVLSIQGRGRGSIEELKNNLGQNIFYGDYIDPSPIYGDNQMSGIFKRNDYFFSKPLGNFSTNGVEVIEDPLNRVILEHTRELISKIANELFKACINKN